ncbi:MAG: hypothetical protein ACREBD_12885, partial [Blastocatellia bacterium]
GLRQAIATRIREATGLDVHRVALVPAGTLLRTTSGKLQRRKMKQLYEQGELPELTSGQPSGLSSGLPSGLED